MADKIYPTYPSVPRPTYAHGKTMYKLSHRHVQPGVTAITETSVYATLFIVPSEEGQDIRVAQYSDAMTGKNVDYGPVLLSDKPFQYEVETDTYSYPTTFTGTYKSALPPTSDPSHIVPYYVGSDYIGINYSTNYLVFEGEVPVYVGYSSSYSPWIDLNNQSNMSNLFRQYESFIPYFYGNEKVDPLLPEEIEVPVIWNKFSKTYEAEQTITVNPPQL